MNPNDSDARLTAERTVVAISAEPRTSSNSRLRLTFTNPFTIGMKMAPGGISEGRFRW